jgi:hypothetical protein
MPIIKSTKEYMSTITNKQRATNSNLANVLNQVGVRCTPCMESHIRALKSEKAREDYLRLLKISPENIQKIQETFVAP